MSLCQLIEERISASPAKAFEDARWAYTFLDDNPSAHAFLFDEREYYLGELALLTGIAARLMGQREDSRAWLDRAETWFLLTVNSAGEIARLTYQRLALKIEDRNFADVERLALPLAEVFFRAGSKEHALKSRFLYGVALRETGNLAEALTTFEQILGEAKKIGSSKLVENALVILIQIHSQYGDAPKALALAHEATPVLRASNNRMLLGKLQWGLADLLRSKAELSQAVAAYRAAQQEFREIGLRADAAALHLVIADVLLELGHERQAEWEIRAALPAIEELKMVPEGFAAMSLLRESLRRRSIDRQALRKLHGYFEEAGS